MARVLLALVVAGFVLVSSVACATVSPEVPENAALIYHGPAQNMTVSLEGLERPGELYIVDASSGNVAWAVYVPPAEEGADGEGGDTAKQEIGGKINRGDTYTVYYSPRAKQMESVEK